MKLENGDASASNKPIELTLFEIVELLSKRYIGLDPLSILNSDTMQVLDLWTMTILHDRNEKNGSNKSFNNKDEEVRERVTSKTATWH